jgi:hypothetical protein
MIRWQDSAAIAISEIVFHLPLTVSTVRYARAPASAMTQFRRVDFLCLGFSTSYLFLI